MGLPSRPRTACNPIVAERVSLAFPEHIDPPMNVNDFGRELNIGTTPPTGTFPVPMVRSRCELRHESKAHSHAVCSHWRYVNYFRNPDALAGDVPRVRLRDRVLSPQYTGKYLLEPA